MTEALLAWDLLGWVLVVWTVAFGACLLAGIVRGIVGFGYALIMISALNLVALPAEVVPLATILDLLGGIKMMPQVWRDVHWSGVRWLGLGALTGVPAGIWLLVSLDADTMRLGISLAILISVILIARGFTFAKVPGSPLMFLTGGLSGLLSGSGGIPGPPVILLYLSSPLPIISTRATTVAFFLLVDSMALIGMSSQGLVTSQTLLRAAVLIPVTFLGISIGAGLFKFSKPAQVKTSALWLLAMLAIVGVGKVLIP
jgi:uncharacterized membrane protein YfcA